MPPAKLPYHSDLIDLLIRRAPALYAAGVTSLSIDGLSATIGAAVAQPTESDETVTPPPKQHIDPMQDPASYPSGRVPGFTRPQATDGDS